VTVLTVRVKHGCIRIRPAPYHGQRRTDKTQMELTIRPYHFRRWYCTYHTVFWRIVCHHAFLV